MGPIQSEPYQRRHLHVEYEKLGQTMFEKTMLLLSGILAIGVGVAMLLFPVTFQGFQGVRFMPEPGILNEIRAAGVPIIAVGAFCLVALQKAQLKFAATSAAVVLYLGYGLARILGFLLDGMPHMGLVLVSALELGVGTACLVLLMSHIARR